jgi:hypothetical protein
MEQISADFRGGVKEYLAKEAGYQAHPANVRQCFGIFQSMFENHPLFPFYL